MDEPEPWYIRRGHHHAFAVKDLDAMENRLKHFGIEVRRFTGNHPLTSILRSNFSRDTDLSMRVLPSRVHSFCAIAERVQMRVCLEVQYAKYIVPDTTAAQLFLYDPEG